MNQPILLKQAYPAISFDRAAPSATVINVGLQKRPYKPVQDIALNARVARPKASHQIQYPYWGLSIAAHVLVIYLVAFTQADQPHILKPAEPITVSLIAPPAPVMVPIIEPQPEPVKPAEIKKTVAKPKKVVKAPKDVVKTIVPIINEHAPKIEATTEPVITETPEPTQTVEPVISQVPVVAEAKAVPVAKPAAPAEKIEPPKFGVAYLNNPAPDYPGMSRRMGEEGRVLLKVLVSADGNADSVQLEQTSGSERLDQAAINAVKRWRFVPAQLAGKALSAYVLVPVKFSLDS